MISIAANSNKTRHMRCFVIQRLALSLVSPLGVRPVAHVWMWIQLASLGEKKQPLNDLLLLFLGLQMIHTMNSYAGLWRLCIVIQHTVSETWVAMHGPGDSHIRAIRWYFNIKCGSGCLGESTQIVTTRWWSVSTSPCANWNNNANSKQNELECEVNATELTVVHNWNYSCVEYNGLKFCIRT